MLSCFCRWQLINDETQGSCDPYAQPITSAGHVTWQSPVTHGLKHTNLIDYKTLLWPPCVADAVIIFSSRFFLLSFLVFSSPNLSRRPSQTGCLPYFYTCCGPSANLECRSEMCCARLAGNAGPKNRKKIRHPGTIAQLCRPIYLQLRHVDNRKNLLSSNRPISSRCLRNRLWRTSAH